MIPNRIKSLAARSSLLTYLMTDYREPLYLLSMILGGVFSSELFVMVILRVIEIKSHFVLIFFDAFLLIIIIFPILYMYVVRPMSNYIKQSKQMQKEISDANEFLETVFSATNILIAYMDTRFRLVRANRAYAEACGFTSDGLVGKSHFGLFPEEEPVLRGCIDEVLKGKPCYGFDRPLTVNRGGMHHRAYWDWNLVPVRDSGGLVCGFVLTLVDVTHRKEAEEAIHAVERRFQAIFNQTYQAICLLSPDGIILEANQTFVDWLRATEPSPVGRSLPDVLEPCLAQEVLRRLKSGLESVANGTSHLARLELERGGGIAGPAEIDVSIKPVSAPSGITAHLIFEGRDISDRKRAEAIIQRSAERAMLLSEISEGLLHAGTNLSAVLETVVRGATKMVADSCIVRMLSVDGAWLVPAAFSQSGSEEPRASREVLAQGLQSVREGLEGIIAQTGEPLLPPGLPGDPITLPESAIRPWPAGLGVQSAVVLPLLDAGTLVGTMTNSRNESRGPFGADDLELLRELACKTSIAIQNARLFEEINRHRAQLRSLSRQMVDIQEAERRHVARELHDEAGQTLTLLRVALELIERKVHDPQAVMAGIADMKRSLETVMENLHRLGMDLRPASLDHLGLVPAIRQLIDAVTSKHGLRVQFETLTEISRLTPEMETSLYRIVQEALTNVIRHSRADSVDMLLDQRDGRLILVIEDSGIGFVSGEAASKGRLGLFGMRERVDMMQGKLTIESAPGKGTVIHVEVPYGV